jgi:hypothetical protein
VSIGKTTQLIIESLAQTSFSFSPVRDIALKKKDLKHEQVL